MTQQVWGMLEYMDDVLGRLFDFMERSKLRENTYVLVMSDNGAELYPEERKGMHRQVRRRCCWCPEDRNKLDCRLQATVDSRCPGCCCPCHCGAL